MPSHEKPNSDQSKPPLKLATPAQITILSMLTKEFDDWMTEHENDTSLRDELKVRLEYHLELPHLAHLLIDQYDPLTNEFRVQYLDAIARATKILKNKP